MPDIFEITNDHITLLRAADWDNGEGTPGIDWKRPYLGTSSVRSALAEILIPGYREMTDEQTEAIHDEHDDRLWDLHTDLGKVIEIGIATLSLAPGIYRRGDDGWKLVTCQEILDLPMDADEDGGTIRDYLVSLLAALWAQGEGFSGKWPFGDSGWQIGLYAPLIHAGLIAGNLDPEHGYIVDCADEAGDRIIASVIRSLGAGGQTR